MSYRIWLYTSEHRRLELFDALKIENFPTEESTKDEEYPDYRVYKDEMKNILIQYQFLLKNSAKDKMKKQTLVSNDMQNYIQYHYFQNLIDNELLIHDSDSFLLQYFYLVELYRKMNNETFYKITHG